MDASRDWSPWRTLHGAHRDSRIPTSSGLYRIRGPDRAGLLYIGQSGRLRSRLGDLQAAFKDEIPYNDPHTAAPCLWVLRVHDGAELEVSVCDAPADVPARKALECVEVSLHRREHGVSPYANFGRMPPGWVKSSQNNARLKARDALRRGYQDEAAVRSPDFPSVLDTDRSPESAHWADFGWTPWTWEAPPADAVGLYRVRRPGEERLLYIGQGRLRTRLARTRSMPSWLTGLQARCRQTEGIPGSNCRASTSSNSWSARTT